MLTVVAAAAATLLAPAPTARAQDGVGDVNPVELTRHCREVLARTTRHGVARTHEIASRTLGAIAQAADEGAPSGVIFHIGANGKEAIDAVTRVHIERVNMVSLFCLRTLNEFGEFPNLTNQIRESRRKSIARLLHARELACRRIVNAVRDTTGVSLDFDASSEHGESLDETGDSGPDTSGESGFGL